MNEMSKEITITRMEVLKLTSQLNVLDSNKNLSVEKKARVYKSAERGRQKDQEQGEQDKEDNKRHGRPDKGAHGRTRVIAWQIQNSMQRCWRSTSLTRNGTIVNIKIIQGKDFVPLYKVTFPGIGDATKLLVMSLRSELTAMVPIDPARIEDKRYMHRAQQQIHGCRQHTHRQVHTGHKPGDEEAPHLLHSQHDAGPRRPRGAACRRQP